MGRMTAIMPFMAIYAQYTSPPPAPTTLCSLYMRMFAQIHVVEFSVRYVVSGAQALKNLCVYINVFFFLKQNSSISFRKRCRRICHFSFFFFCCVILYYLFFWKWWQLMTKCSRFTNNKYLFERHTHTHTQPTADTIKYLPFYVRVCRFYMRVFTYKRVFCFTICKMKCT